MIKPRRRNHIVPIALAVTSAALGYFGARLTTPPPSTPAAPAGVETAAAVPVQTTALRTGEITEMASAYGTVQMRPGDAVALSVPFESVTRRVRVAVGETVAAGAALADVDASPDARLQLRQAEDTLAAADRAAEQARRRRDEQLATNADVATAEQQQQAARLQLDAQRARGVGDARTVTASAAGTVTAIATQAGQINPAGAALVTIAPAGSVEVRLGVDPADVTALSPGAAVTLADPNLPNTVRGTVRQAGQSVNAQTRLCEVSVRVAADSGLRAGAFVEATFPRQTATGLIVPRTATQWDDGAWCVDVVRDGKVARRAVTLGLSDGRDVLVRGDGLAEGDAVVTERNGDLDDGAAVTVGPVDEDDK